MTDGGIILVYVPTCMRPKMLAACLESISQTHLPKDYEIRLLVLDNDVAESAREVFEAMSFPFVARYIVEPKRGLSTIRNRAIDEAQKEKAVCLASVDDDQTVEPHWLSALVEGLTETGADVISGKVELVFPGGQAPYWTPHIKGGLVLMHERLFSKMRFDEEFNLTGGEDYDFHVRLTRLGFVSRQIDKMLGQEPMGMERMTLRSHVFNHWQRQTSYVFSHRKAEGFLKSLLFLPKGVIKIIKGLLYCVFAVLFGKKLLMRGIKNIVAGAGYICGIFIHGGYKPYAVVVGE